VNSQTQDLGGQRGGAQGKNVRSTMKLAVVGLAGLFSSATNADAGAREISESSYGFADSLWTKTEIEHSGTLSSFSGGGAHQCSANCGLGFGATVVRRNDLLTSNNADLSARATADANGHAMGVGGAIVVERLESDASGSLTNWVVVSERTLDENGSHSWSRLSGVPSDALWQPSDLYRFEGSSFSTDFAVGGKAGATPEPSTWMMLLMGFAGLTFAGYRNSRTPCRPISILKRVSSQ
jgi:PEP-CTERM motif